jgi:hypothetical protein
MTTDQYIAIIGHAATWVTALATLATAILIWLTLHEMAAQRRYEYKPDIVISERPIYAFSEEYGTVRLPTRWTAKNLSDEEIIEEIIEHEYTDCSFPLLNLGLGAAKRIKVRWGFDAISIIKYVRNLCEQNAVPIAMHEKDGWLWLQCGKQERMISMNHGLEQSVSYLLPAGSDSHNAKIQMPYLLITLSSVAIYLHHAILKENKRFIYFPPSSIQIDYDELENRNHSRRFEVRMEFQSITSGDAMTFSGLIKFTQNETG